MEKKERICDSRALGANERMIWLGDQSGPSNFIIGARISGLVDEHLLRSALDLLPKRYPLLRIRIEIRDGKPTFVSENILPIPLHIEARLSDDHWQTMVKQEINKPFSWSVGPLVRVLLLKDTQTNDVLLTFHHAIGDGMSGLLILRYLLTLLEQLSKGSTTSLQGGSIQPPVEELLPESMRGVGGFIKSVALLGNQVASNIYRYPQILARDGDGLSEDRLAHIIYRIFSQEETLSLVERCRNESTTVQGAVCAALLIAAANQISPIDPVTLSCLSAIDLRQFLTPLVREEMGFYASMVITTHHIGRNTEFWDLARDIRESVIEAIEKGEPFLFLSLLSKLFPKNNTPSDFTRRSSKIYPVTVSVTNLGDVHIPERYGSLLMQKIYFILADQSVPEHLNFALVTYSNRLSINFVYTEPMMSKQRATAFFEDAINILKSALISDTSIKP